MLGHGGVLLQEGAKLGTGDNRTVHVLREKNGYLT